MQVIVNQYGAALRVREGRFELRSDKEVLHLAPAQVGSIVVSEHAVLSAAAIALATEHDIDIVIVNRRGQPLARLWHPHFGSISTIRRKQLHFSGSAAGLAWVRGLLVEKLEQQIALLQALAPAESAAAISPMLGYREKLLDDDSRDLAQAAGSWRGWEGNASRLYFGALSAALPPMYRFEGRSRRPARDMFNSALNYCYGMLYNYIEQALIVSGIDPYIGIFHRDEYSRPVLVYDVIERYRVWADYCVFQLCRQQVLFREFFSADEEGLWMEDPAKKIVAHGFNDYLHELVELEGDTRSRLNHIRRHAQMLAQTFKNLPTP